MKFHIQTKHLILSAFAFFAIFSFAFPFTARAQNENVVYGGLTRPDENLSIRSWGKNFIIGNAIDIALAFPCGGENDKEKVWGEDPDACVPPLSQITASLEGDEPRMIGGAASYTAMAMEYGINEPLVPTNMALYLDDTFNDTIFSTRESYAQELTDLSRPTEFFQASTLELWKFSRNIALSLLGVLLAIAGLSILFRSKLSPQVTVTVANVLPYLPISIIGIVLSYPIIAVAYNLLAPLMSVAYSIGTTVFAEIAPAAQVQSDLGIYTIVAGVIGIILTAGGVVVLGVILAFPLIVVILIALYLLLVGLFKYIFEYAKTIVLFVFYVAAFPIISAIAILPGKQNLVTLLFKKVLANLLALPIMTLMVIVGLGFIASMGSVSLSSDADFTYLYNSSGGALFSSIIKFAIGFGIIQNSFKARSILEDAFGAGGTIMSSFKGGPPAGGPGGRR